ncbi:MAG: hypothetical protein RL120_09150 [Gammaproteobacteria bacterium]
MQYKSFSRLLLSCLMLAAANTLAAQPLPQFEVDPAWPQLPFGDRWLTGGLGGVCIDDNDHVFILNRQNVVPDDLDGARLAPPVIELDPAGRVVRGWGTATQLGSRLHDCHVDPEGNIWIVNAAGGELRKFSRDGSRLLLQVGEPGRYDSSDGSRQGEPLNSDRAQFFLPAAVDVDTETGDVYLADGELPGGNTRIAVLNKEGEYLRQWRLQRQEGEQDIIELPHCLRLSNDGLVYVCDRRADRIQVFNKQGVLIKIIDVGFQPLSSPGGRSSGTRGNAVVLDFSPDPEQRYMYVVNQNSVTVEILERDSGRWLGRFGDGPGRYPGQFILPHGIAVDSHGNVYVAEQEGARIQKFTLIED